MQVSMVDLIIPDVHNKIDVADKILNTITHDHAWFLGDYWDNFHDTAADAVAVAQWVLEKLNNPRITLLLGNHDYHYWKPHLQKCSGYTWQKEISISEIVKPNDFEKLKTHAWVQGWLLSHAGYSLQYAHPVKGLTPQVTAEWDAKMEAAHAANKLPELFWCGKDRYGNNHHSGVIWQDWWTSKKVTGVNQIVGHTPHHTWRESKGDYCLDTGLKHVGLLQNGKLEVRDIQ